MCLKIDIAFKCNNFATHIYNDIARNPLKWVEWSRINIPYQ